MLRNPVLKKRLSLTSLGLLAVLALMAFAVPHRPARADEGTPFKATLPVQFVISQICDPNNASCLTCTGPSENGFYVEAQGLGDTSLGPLFAQLFKCFNPNGAPFGTYAGTLTTTAPSGTDSVTWAYAGKNDNAGDFYGFQPFSGTLTVISGTGKFAGAHGSATFTAAGPPTFTAGPSPIQFAGTAFYYITGQLELTNNN